MIKSPTLECESRILSEPKRGKARSVRPGVHAICHRPVCGGEIQVTIFIETHPYLGGMDYELEASITCSRCRNGYVSGWDEYRHMVAMSGRSGVNVTGQFALHARTPDEVDEVAEK